MIYTQGTLSTVSGSAIVRGTGTKFKDNLNGIAPGQVILIQSGSSNLLHMIQAVNSDTELVLADNVNVTLNNVTYQIQVTVPDSVSDGVRHMVAINAYIVQFLQNMNKWMSQNGTVEVTLPNGQTVSLQSIKAIQTAVDEKLDKTGGTVKGNITTTGWMMGQDVWVKRASDGKEERVYHPFNKPTAADVGALPVTGGEITGKVFAKSDMDVAGWVGGSQLYDRHANGGWSRAYSEAYPPNAAQIGALALTGGTVTGDIYAQEAIRVTKWVGAGMLWEGKEGAWKRVWSELNSWADNSGYLRKSSPIIQIHPDGKFATNDESEGATVSKTGLGHYQITGVLGYNADGAWGVHGGISSPKNNNGLELIYLDDKVNKDGSITIETFHRQHSHLPARFQNKRIKALVNGEKVYYQDGEPCDIPEGCRLDVRVQMPANSVWNVGQKVVDGEVAG